MDLYRSKRCANILIDSKFHYTGKMGKKNDVLARGAFKYKDVNLFSSVPMSTYQSRGRRKVI